MTITLLYLIQQRWSFPFRFLSSPKKFNLKIFRKPDTWKVVDPQEKGGSNVTFWFVDTHTRAARLSIVSFSFQVFLFENSTNYFFSLFFLTPPLLKKWLTMAKKVGVLLKMFLFQEDIYSLPQVNLETKKTLRVHVITSSISRDLCIEDSQRCRDEKRVECHRQSQVPLHLLYLLLPLFSLPIHLFPFLFWCRSKLIRSTR